MAPKFTTELKIALDQSEPERVLKIVDPDTRVGYYFVREDVYEKFRTLLEEVDFDIREAYPLMDAAAQAAGLGDSAENLYDDLDPRRNS